MLRMAPIGLSSPLSHLGVRRASPEGVGIRAHVEWVAVANGRDEAHPGVVEAVPTVVVEVETVGITGIIVGLVDVRDPGCATPFRPDRPVAGKTGGVVVLVVVYLRGQRRIGFVEGAGEGP